MEEISKKDLLILTGISYGQLYRWKRKGLIPDEWFIKRASFTGQETFFPKEQILDRIDRILELKDEVSLEELSEVINKRNQSKTYSKARLLEKNIYRNPEVLILEDCENLDFEQTLMLKMIDGVYGELSNKSGFKDLYAFLASHRDEITNQFKTIFFTFGNNAVCAVAAKEALTYGNGLIRVDVKQIQDNLKLILLI